MRLDLLFYILWVIVMFAILIIENEYLLLILYFCHASLFGFTLRCMKDFYKK